MATALVPGYEGISSGVRYRDGDGKLDGLGLQVKRRNSSKRY